MAVNVHLYKHLEPTTGIEPVNLFLTKEALYRLSYVGMDRFFCSDNSPNFFKTPKNRTVQRSVWSGRRGSNSRHSAWKAEALPTELLPLNKKQWTSPSRNKTDTQNLADTQNPGYISDERLRSYSISLIWYEISYIKPQLKIGGGGRI